jgi:hypothetical protein
MEVFIWIVAILTTIFIIIGHFFLKYLKKHAKRHRKKPQRSTEFDKELNEWDIDRAKVEREIFIWDTLLKFLPASILTISISMLYVGNQDINFYGYHILNYLVFVVIFLFLFIGLLLWRSNKLYRDLYPIIREIEILKKVSSDTRILEMKQDFQRKFVRIEGEKQDIEKEKHTLEMEKIVVERKLELIQTESKIIKSINEIMSDLQSNSPQRHRHSALIFKEICTNQIVIETENEELINRIKEYIFLISLSMHKEILTNIVDGFHRLMMNSQKCIYYDMAKEDFYEKIKEFVTAEGNYGQSYKIKMHHIFCNIANLEDLNLVLMPFHHVDYTKHPGRVYVEHTTYSLLIYDHKNKVLNKIVELLEDSEILNAKTFYDLQEEIVSVRPEIIMVHNSIPRCKRNNK